MFALFTSSRRRKYGWLPSWAAVQNESAVHPHAAEEKAHLFEAHNAGTTELEVLNWLHATVMMLKPDAILETGAADGLGTIALASACRHNGIGHVHSVELDPAQCQELDRKLRRERLRDLVTIHCQDSREYLRSTATVFDLAFYDSMCEIRAEEFGICLDRGIVRQAAIFHDTSPYRCRTLKGWPSEELHTAYRERLLEYARDPRCTGWMESTLSRGVFCLFVGRRT
jgi:predicted O-methyltransferase YrrM